MTRRGLLGALAAAGAGGLAGCLDGGQRSVAAPSGRAAGTFARRYDVGVDGTRSRVTVEIGEDAYAAARERERSFSRAVGVARDSATLGRITAQLSRRYDTRAARVAAAQAFAAGITYARDVNSTGRDEYVRYPVETLVEDAGDCEDLAVVLAGLLTHLGIRTGLVVPRGHCAVLAARADLPASVLADDPLTVSLDGVEYVYVEAVERHPPGAWARDYGERALLAAYRGRWYPLEVGALAEEFVAAVEEGHLRAAVQFVE